VADAVITALRPDRQTLDRGDEHYDGAQVIALGATATIRAIRVGVQVVALSLVPVAARTIGHPLYVRTVNQVITEVFESTYTVGDAPHGDAAAIAASVAAGRYSYGIIPREITGEPLTYWEG
jgi:hypothetical protein